MQVTVGFQPPLGQTSTPLGPGVVHKSEKSVKLFNSLTPNTTIVALVQLILHKLRVLTTKLGLLLLRVGSTYSFVVCIKLLMKDKSLSSYHFY